MKTYQDLIALGENEKKRREFIRAAVSEYKSSDMFLTAKTAEEYDRRRNPTILNYKKMITNMLGQQIEDVWSANYKIVSNFFNRFITQENLYLLGNGLNLEHKEKKKKLGFDFDMRLVDMGRNALVHGVSFGFWDFDKMRVFSALEFCPLYDEENGALRAGIRFWQVENGKPERYTLFEENGYTEYIKTKEDEELREYAPKKTYVEIVNSSEIDGTEIFDGENYPGFPIIPMWANEHKQSELVGMQEPIDCYDLIKSGFANNVDDASEIFWIIKNAGGMKDVDIAKFLQRMKTVRGAAVDSEEGGGAEMKTVDIPYEARSVLLERLEKDLYNDFMCFNVQQISAGKATATEINAAYQPFDNKVDKFEFCVFDFLGKLFKIIGMDEEPKPFNRSKVTNQLEVTQTVLMAAQYLDEETILSKIPWLSPEEVEKIMERKTAENIERFEGNNFEGGGSD